MKIKKGMWSEYPKTEGEPYLTQKSVEMIVTGFIIVALILEITVFL